MAPAPGFPFPPPLASATVPFAPPPSCPGRHPTSAFNQPEVSLLLAAESCSLIYLCAFMRLLLLYTLGARRRASAAGSLPRGSRGSPAGPGSPAAPQTRRHSHSRIRGRKGASILAKRSGAVGLQDLGGHCPRVNRRQRAFGGWGRSNKLNATFIHLISLLLSPPLDR